MFLALLIAASPALDASAAPLLTSVIAAGAAVDARVDVLSSEDLRRAVDVEANQRLLGCDSQSQSCLAELAAAMGAGIVVVGQGGRLGESLVLSVDLFDSEHATSGGRALIRETTVDGLASKAQSETHRLVADYLAAHPRNAGGPPLKVLVLDARLSNVDATGAGSSAPFPWLAVTGGTVAAVGALGVGLGVVADAAASSERTAADHATVQLDALKHVTNATNDGDAALLAYVVGGLLAAAGATTLVVALVSE